MALNTPRLYPDATFSTYFPGAVLGPATEATDQLSMQPTGRRTDCKLTTEPTDRAEPREGTNGAVH